MKTYVHWAVCSLYLAVTAICGAAGFTPIPFNCSMAQSSAVTNIHQRIEVSAAGFFGPPPSRRKLVRQIPGLARAQFLESPAERGSFRTALITR
jgi:hypothetical protein